MAGLKKYGFYIGAVILALLAAWWLVQAQQQEKPIDFSTQIKPILNQHCTTCHGGVKKLGDLSLLFEEEAFQPGKSGHPPIVPGKAHESELYRRIAAEDEFERMPPEGPGLTVEEIATMKKWINQGAKWGKHWAYIPLQKTSPPTQTTTFG